MASLGAPPLMEVCNDLLRLQGRKGRIDGMFATLDVRGRRCTYTESPPLFLSSPHDSGS